MTTVLLRAVTFEPVRRTSSYVRVPRFRGAVTRMRQDPCLTGTAAPRGCHPPPTFRLRCTTLPAGACDTAPDNVNTAPTETLAGARTVMTGRDAATTCQAPLVASTRLRSRTSTRNCEAPSGNDTRADHAVLPFTAVWAIRFHARPTLRVTTTADPRGARATRPRTVVAVVVEAGTLASIVTCTGAVEVLLDGDAERVGVAVGDFDAVFVGDGDFVAVRVGDGDFDADGELEPLPVADGAVDPGGARQPPNGAMLVNQRDFKSNCLRRVTALAVAVAPA